MNYQILCRNFKTLIFCLSLITYAQIIKAITIEDAIILAHENNYEILSEQQNFKATKTQKPIAYSDFLPNVTASNANIHNVYTNSNLKELYGSPYYRQYGLSVSQPLFNGGSSYAKLKIADKSIQSGLAKFDSVSNQITVNAIAAYENVLSTREIYEINIKSQYILQKNLDFTQIKFDVGVVTKTDVLQTEVRLSDAIAEKEKALADMKNAEANYERVIGVKPTSSLELIDVNHITLPNNIEDLIEIVKSKNPMILASKHDSDAAKYQIAVATAQLSPTVSANAQISRSSDAKIRNSGISSSSNSYTLQVNIPLFQGGQEYATIKQKKHLAKKAKYDSDSVESKVIEACIGLWNNYKTNASVVEARLSAINAATQALEGVKEEVNVGTRTTLDLLNAEKELFIARVAHRIAKQEQVILIYQILQIMGSLSVSLPDIF